MLTISEPISRESQDKRATTEKPENPPEYSDENSPREKNDEPYIPTGTRATKRFGTIIKTNRDFGVPIEAMES